MYFEQSLLFFLFNLMTFLFLFFERKRMLLNPAIIYLVFNWIMVVGCFNFFDFSNKSDIIHAIILTLTPLTIFLGYKFASLSNNLKFHYEKFWKKESLSLKKNIKRRILFLYIFTVFLSLLYYQLVGYNLMFLTLSSGVDDFVSMRLNAYSGENYYAPGLFNQFKNTIFPILFIYFFYLNRNKKWIYIYALVMGLTLLYSITGTGQRTFLMMTVLILFTSFMGLKKGDINKKVFLIVGVSVVFLFGMLSVSLKRNTDASFFGALQGLIYRIFDSNQYSAVVGFRYVDRLEIQYGYEWLVALKGLIPGIKGSDLSNRVFNEIFGGFRGTAPLSVWGSAYHNFGFLGTLVLGFLIGFVYTKIYLRYLKGVSSIIRTCVYSAVFVFLFTWIAGAPSQLLINGLLGCFLISIVIKSAKVSYETNTTIL